jgi:hypothetical protein
MTPHLANALMAVSGSLAARGSRAKVHGRGQILGWVLGPKIKCAPLRALIRPFTFDVNKLPMPTSIGSVPDGATYQKKGRWTCWVV